MAGGGKGGAAPLMILNAARRKYGESCAKLLQSCWRSTNLNSRNTVDAGSHMALMDILTDSIKSVDDRWIRLGFTECFRLLKGGEHCLPLPELSSMIRDIYRIIDSNQTDESLIASWLYERYINTRHNVAILSEEKLGLLRIDLSGTTIDCPYTYTYLANVLLGSTIYLNAREQLDHLRYDKIDHDAMEKSWQCVIDLIGRNPLDERQCAITLFQEVVHRLATESQIWLCTKMFEIIGPTAYASVCHTTGMKPLVFVSPSVVDSYRSRRLRTRNLIMKQLLDYTPLPKDLCILVAEYAWDAHL